MTRFLSARPVPMLGLASLFVASLGLAAQADDGLQGFVDAAFDAVSAAVQAQGLDQVIQIDHARLAAAEGVEMPPSRVQLFSDAAVNAAVMSKTIRAGLDVPFRVLSYDAAGVATLSYTSSAFLAARHGVNDAAALSAFDARLGTVLDQLGDLKPQPVTSEGVGMDFAILELKSNYDVPETVARLKETVTAQSDTVWFGEMDLQAEAAGQGVPLVPAQLLLFGGPAPGGVAMAEFPAIGLDAFCQKLLVYQGDDGKAVVLFNDIAALAEHYYGRSIEPHAMLNKRLTQTFKSAIE